MPALSRAVVDCRDVRKSFEQGATRVDALSGASLHVSLGEFVALRGASGSGKTTLLSVLAGLERADDGDIVVLGHDLMRKARNDVSEFRLRNIGVVFQDNNLIDEFSAVENVMLPLQGLGSTMREARPMAVEALETMGVADVAERRPRDMSGGQRQRVGIARAIVGDRSILIADEPTGALDSANSAALFSLVANLCRERQLTAVVATHDPLVDEFASRALEVRDGVITD